MNKNELSTLLNEINCAFKKDLSEFLDSHKSMTKSVQEELDKYLIDNNFDEKISVKVNTHYMYKNKEKGIEIAVAIYIFYDNKAISYTYYQEYNNDIFKILSAINIEKENAKLIDFYEWSSRDNH